MFHMLHASSPSNRPNEQMAIGAALVLMQCFIRMASLTAKIATTIHFVTQAIFSKRRDLYTEDRISRSETQQRESAAMTDL